MATFEERILEFLDGERENGTPLDESSREQLLREVSESPEKRRVFTAHLKLRELLGVGQKPSSAPLEVQRNLAQKLPVLALHLPYLAAEGKRERAAGLWGSGASWMRTAAIVGILGVTAGLWYIFSSRQHETAGNRTASSSSMTSHTPLESERTASPASGASAVPNTTASNINRSAAKDLRKPADIASDRHQAANSRIPGFGHPNARNTNRESLNSLEAGQQSAHLKAADAKKSSGTEANLEYPDVIERTIKGIAAKPRDLAVSIQPSVPIGLLSMSEPERGRFTARALPQLRMLMLPSVQLSSAEVSQKFSTLSGLTSRLAYWLDVDRSFSANWLLGLRVGYVPFAQMQAFTYAAPTPGYPLLKRYKRETRLVAANGVTAAGPSATYVAGVFGTEVHLAAFGLLGGSGLSWMTGIDGTIDYVLSSRMSFSARIGFDVTSSAVATDGGDPVPTSFTLGVQNLSSAPTSLITPALTLSAGITFRP